MEEAVVRQNILAEPSRQGKYQCEDKITTETKIKQLTSHREAPFKCTVGILETSQWVGLSEQGKQPKKVGSARSGDQFRQDIEPW